MQPDQLATSLPALSLDDLQPATAASTHASNVVVSVASRVHDDDETSSLMTRARRFDARDRRVHGDAAAVGRFRWVMTHHESP